MRYLYGDGSEFPLNENFLQTLGAATDACVSLLEIDAAQVRVRRALEDENAAAIAELGELGALRGAVERALSRSSEHRPSVQRVAAELRQLVCAHVEKARAETKHRREEIQRKAAVAHDAPRVLTALERFLATHQLPNTTWALSWKAGLNGTPSVAQAYALMPRGLAATMQVQIPATHLWARPVKVSRLERNLAIRMERKSWFGQSRMCDERLDRYYVTRVVHTPMQEALLLSSSDRRPSPGLLITLRDQRDEQVRVVRVDAQENPIGEPVVLVDSFRVMVQGLWVQVQRTIRDLVLHRRRVEWATLNGKSVLELDRPVGLVRALVSAIAPWVRNIRRRSKAPGAMELIQQRNDGSNQQLIISYYELVRKYRHLSPQHRSMFDAYGIAPTRKTPSRGRPRYDHLSSAPTAEPSAPHQPKISGVHPAAPSQAAPSSPSQPLYQLPPPSAPPRPGPSATVARSEALPPTIPPPPPEAYLPRRLPPTIPPRLPEAYAVGAPPPTIRPPAAGARRDAELTRPALRVVQGGR